MLSVRRTRLSPRRPGTVAVVAAVSMSAILAMVALVLDGGLLLDDRRRVQAAADSAAEAAAADLYANYGTNQGADPNSSARTSALTTAATNGYDSSKDARSTVTVNIPPKSGAFAGVTDGYVEVVIQYNRQRLFSTVFGANDLPVTARTVANGKRASLSNLGLLALNPTINNALEIGSDGSAIVKNGVIAVNSTSLSATTFGSIGGAKCDSSYLMGGSKNSGNSPGFSCNSGSGGKVNYVKTPTPDPLASLPAPSQSGMAVCQSSKKSYQGTTTLQPGIYRGGCTFSCNVTLQPGIYYVESGGMDFSGAGSITGTGVMIYNAGTSGNDAIYVGGTSVNLSPPTSGAYQGVTLFQARNNPAKLELSSKGSLNSLTGSIYAPAARIHVGSEGSLNATQLIADVIEIGSKGNVNIDVTQNAPRSRTIRLVE